MNVPSLCIGRILDFLLLRSKMDGATSENSSSASRPLQRTRDSMENNPSFHAQMRLK
jgi:hypothetical protein